MEQSRDSGGELASVLGHDAVVASNAAVNEAINNATSTKSVSTAVMPPVVFTGPCAMMLGLPPLTLMQLPSKPNQYGLDEQYALKGIPNQSGQFRNTGTIFPAVIGDFFTSIIISLPNQAEQWFDNIIAKQTLCFASPMLCTSPPIMPMDSGGEMVQTACRRESRFHQLCKRRSGIAK